MFEQFAEQIQPLVFNALLAIISSAISYVAYWGAGFIKGQLAALKERTSAEAFRTLQHFAEIAVQAIEQKAVKGIIENTAVSKRNAAIRETQQFLNAAGLRYFDAEQIWAAIEAALRRGVHQRFEDFDDDETPPGEKQILVELL